MLTSFMKVLQRDQLTENINFSREMWQRKHWNKTSIQFGKSSTMDRCPTATHTKSKLPRLINVC